MNRLILNGLINCPEKHFPGTNGPVNDTGGGSLDTIHRTSGAFRNVSGIEECNFLII
jgi:hypothetical protein